MPRCACSIRPVRGIRLPGALSATAPNSSTSTSPAGSAPQSTVTSGPRRRDAAWSIAATRPLPVPVSPWISTSTPIGATCAIVRRSCATAGEWP